MKAFFKENFKTLYFFYQYLGYRMFLLLFFSFLMVLMDSVGLAMFLPLLQVADEGAAIGKENDKVGYYISQLFDMLHLDLNVYTMLVLIVILFSAKALFAYYASKYSVINQQLFAKGLRLRLADGLRDMAYKDFVTADIGRTQNSLIGEAWQVVNACSLYLSAIKNGMFILVYLGFAFFFDWKFSILVALGGGLSNLFYKRYYTKTEKLSRNITQNNHRYSGIVVEVVNHYKYLKATGRNYLFFNRLKDELDRLIKNNIDVGILGARLSAVREPMTILVICVVIMVHTAIFQSPLSAIMIILLLFYRIMQKVMDIQTCWNSYLSGVGTIENMQDFQSYLDQHREVYSGIQPLQRIDSIELKNIQLFYQNYKALNNISLHIEKNQSIAFVGESGSGKTSLINLISTLIPFDEGAFLVNGKGIELFSNVEYKSKIGYIAQEPTIFNADIFDNVTFWAERTDENLQKFEEVIEMSSMKNFLESLAEKEKTLLGNNGINISGGQKQRISIARELYRDVEVLIMDEATSALDSATEHLVKESIESLKGKVTIISIAHRLSTIQHADRIYLMEQGGIVAEGDFEELKQKSTYFRNLTVLQGM
ncbi:ABC transporter ATP-binding protein [Sphingobacterium corticibacterium]|uniref:ABC transporter ATP-binding protein n=1 Tax=Sphingobacterium corticibacterium TaxID=2484746 RepID=A0A4Q6XWB1_9SPHI|nr:ABC transporter ATP-binding protein [Sphingobacterium corticibacterium]RZF61674.1 ABC transporter ATP-binding protein [Sphingobacterium corticibacterium]